MSNPTPETDSLYFVPNFADISAATWHALEAYASDDRLMGEIWTALAERHILDAQRATSAIAEKLIAGNVRGALSERERADLCLLLFALLQAGFEMHVQRLFGE